MLPEPGQDAQLPPHADGGHFPGLNPPTLALSCAPVGAAGEARCLAAWAHCPVPQSPEVVQAVGKLSYNQLVEKIITCKHSCDSNLVTEGKGPGAALGLPWAPWGASALF